MKCDGYEMFHGTVTVQMVSGPLELTGIWLYRPDVNCWYVKRDYGGPGFAESMPPDILSDFRKDDEEVHMLERLKMLKENYKELTEVDKNG